LCWRSCAVRTAHRDLRRRRLTLNSAKHTVVVIPTFNERDNVDRLIPAILGQDAGTTVLVVDDSSPDGTSEVVERLAAANPRVGLLRRAQRQGIGPAYIAGFQHALRNGADYIVQMDADFSHPVAMLKEFQAYIGDFDMVLGSRYLAGITVVN